MKGSLQPGLSFRKEVLIDESRCIGFMGREGMVYATPKMVSDVEYACRDWLVGHLDAGEDSVGTHVTIDHHVLRERKAFLQRRLHGAL